ncbi:AAA family ATPase [Caldisericum sp.]|jgi:ATP-dependent Clp protease ATP-binding subunit ClpA|uniref:AAA family ATPase n=1 Tax=Caldisericum sp. TaxID=2499687 RepID=UPI003D13926E
MSEEAEERLKKASEIEAAGFLLDKLAKEKKIAPIYERKEFVRYCINSLVKGNNLMLVGAHGVGKNAIVESIAIYLSSISDQDFPIKHILETNSSKLLEGCLYVGNLENKLQQLIKNCDIEKTVIFIDNIHFGIGVWASTASPQNDMINIINNSFLPGTRMICSTTPEGLKMIEGVHPEFANKFIKIEVPPTTKEETIEILKSIKLEIQNTYNIIIEDNMLKELVQLTDRFYRSREFPGKAFEMLSRIINENLGKERITIEDLYKHVLRDTGLPNFIIHKSESIDEEKIKNYFNSFIFGQEEAVHEIVLNILKFKTRLNRPDKPVGSFLFVGPSGVGKTELAKVLAKFLFGSEDKLHMYPMSQYNGTDGFKKLLGSPSPEPRDLLYGTGKVLKDVRSSLFSVILFDEIDQASKDVLNGLYQILDEGKIVENNGDITSFVSTIIIMSTNIGMEEFFSKSIGFDSQPESKKLSIRNKVRAKLESVFGEPFLNRVGKIIIFNPLDKNIVKKIVLKIVEDFTKKLPGLVERNLRIELENNVVDFLSDVGYSEKYGARNMYRVIDEYCLNEITTFLASNPQTNNKIFHFKMIEGIPHLADLRNIQD